MHESSADRPAAFHLVRGSVYGIVAVALNGAGGFVFWAIVARAELPATVGSAQRLFTAVLVATYLTSLGLPITVARHCTDRTSRSAGFFRRSTVATVCSSAAAAVVLATVAGPPLLDPLGVHGWASAFAVLTLTISGLSLAVLVEIRLIALRRWGWVLGRVAIVVLARFPLLLIGPADRAVWAFVLVAGLPAASGVVGAVVLHGLEPRRPRLEADDRRVWRNVSSVNYVSLLGSQGPQFLVPLVVALAVGDADFAPFYLAWGATAFVFVLPHMLGQTLLAELARGGDVAPLVGRSLAVSLGATTCIAIGSFAGAPMVGAFLGSDYREAGRVLPWLVGAAIPWSLTCTALAVARARADAGRIVMLTVSFAVTSIAATGLGVATAGVPGAAVGWLVANAGVGTLAGWVVRGSLPDLTPDRSRETLVAPTTELNTGGLVS